MKKKFSAILLVVTVLYINTTLQAQTTGNDIIKLVTEYFALERENIHAQFDKNTFTAYENVWFKGYVFHRKKNLPFFSTVNIFGCLMDADGKILQTKLIYGNLGTFSGNFTLDETFKPGKYYIRFYTNWMNNFIEDESFVYAINVVDPETNLGLDIKKPDNKKITIEVNPEGGTLVSGIVNNIGLHVADCNNNPLPLSSVEIIDNSGRKLQTVALNTYGYGRFEYPATLYKDCKVRAFINNKYYEQALPQPDPKGISLGVNSFSMADKTIFTIRTNQNGYSNQISKPLYLVIHQDNKVLVLDVNLNSTNFEQTIIVPYTDIAEGLNTARIIDGNMAQLAERMFFRKSVESLDAELQKQFEGNSQTYTGKAGYPNLNLSITVLPENTKSFDDTNDIYASFMLLPYIEKKEAISGRYYFTTPSKNKMYELDVMLLNQKSKYEWINIVHNPPKSNFTFDMGITVKGSIPGTINVKDAKIRLFSLVDRLDITTDINEKREFTFNHIIYKESSYVNFTLIRKNKKPVELTLSPQVLRNNSKFGKPLKIRNYNYSLSESSKIISDSILPSKRGTELKEVIIEGSTLKYAGMHGNRNLYAYKIAEMKLYVYQNVLQFIDSYGGFNVSYDPNTGIRISAGKAKVVAKNGRLNIAPGAHASIVYLNNREIVDFEVLSNIEISQVDEIYMSPTYIRGLYKGLIKIYLHKGINPYDTSKTPNIVIKGGFERVASFENNETDLQNESLGVVGWYPEIRTNENGEFSFSLPQPYSKKAKVTIEGFSADGKLISIVKNL